MQGGSAAAAGRGEELNIKRLTLNSISRSASLVSPRRGVLDDGNLLEPRHLRQLLVGEGQRLIERSRRLARHGQLRQRAGQSHAGLNTIARLR